MDPDAVREKQPSRSHPDRVRNALLAAVVFELAVVAAFAADSTGSVSVIFVVGLFLTFLVGVFGLAAFVYYLLTL